MRDRRNISYLIVEDNMDHALLIKETIKKFDSGKNIVHKQDGQKAIMYLEEIEHNMYPDIILLDIKMPKMNGFDVLRFLRKHKYLKHIPVVMLSTSTQEKEVFMAYQMGANTYLPKPVKLEEFIRIISDVDSYWSSTAILPSVGEKNE